MKYIIFMLVLSFTLTGLMAQDAEEAAGSSSGEETLVPDSSADDNASSEDAEKQEEKKLRKEYIMLGPVLGAQFEINSPISTYTRGSLSAYASDSGLFNFPLGVFSALLSKESYGTSEFSVSNGIYVNAQGANFRPLGVMRFVTNAGFNLTKTETGPQFYLGPAAFLEYRIMLNGSLPLSLNVNSIFNYYTDFRITLSFGWSDNLNNLTNGRGMGSIFFFTLPLGLGVKEFPVDKSTEYTFLALPWEFFGVETRYMIRGPKKKGLWSFSARYSFQTVYWDCRGSLIPLSK